MIPEYPWLELVGIRPIMPGECYINSAGEVRMWAPDYESICLYTVIAAANAYNVLRLEDLKIPEGYEPDGETLKDAFRVPAECSWALQPISMLANQYHGKPLGPHFERLCLRKIAPKTKRVVILESDVPDTVAFYEGRTSFVGAAWKVRTEERPL